MILVCENNGFAEFTPRSAHTKVERVSDVVAPYGFERETVDGNDVVAVWDAFGRFLEQARAGRGPMLLECLTHRLRGHYEGDPAAYREAIAADDWQQKDPILRLQRRGARRRLDRRGGRRRDRARGRRGRRGGGAVRAREPVPAARAGGADGLRVTDTTYVKAINAALAEAMRADERVFVLGEDVAEGGPYTATAGLAEEFGTERVRNTPISEAAITRRRDRRRPVGPAAGAGDHVHRLHHARAGPARQRGGQGALHVGRPAHGAARAAHAGRRRHRGGAQHSQSLEAWLTHVPGLKVVMPSRAVDAAGLLASAIADPNPVVFIENKTLYFRREEVPDERRARADRRAPRRCAQGGDVTIVALSRHGATRRWRPPSGSRARASRPR